MVRSSSSCFHVKGMLNSRLIVPKTHTFPTQPTCWKLSQSTMPEKTQGDRMKTSKQRALQEGTKRAPRGPRIFRSGCKSMAVHFGSIPVQPSCVGKLVRKSSYKSHGPRPSDTCCQNPSAANKTNPHRLRLHTVHRAPCTGQGPLGSERQPRFPDAKEERERERERALKPYTPSDEQPQAPRLPHGTKSSKGVLGASMFVWGKVVTLERRGRSGSKLAPYSFR